MPLADEEDLMGAWVTRIDIAARARGQSGGAEPHFFGLDILPAMFWAFHEIARLDAADDGGGFICAWISHNASVLNRQVDMMSDIMMTDH
jgi:hypothetical protein